MTVFRGPISGPKAFGIFATFFVVIIGVNLILAFEAIRTFPGLEVQNSYVASQSFDHDRAAQLALGWTVRATMHQDVLRLQITDPAGAAVKAADLSGTFGRATSVSDDQVPQFVFDGRAYEAPVTARGGNWNLRLVAHAADGTLFQQRIVVLVE